MGTFIDGNFIDGNGAAGMFAEALGIDVTTAMVTCVSCGAAGRFADSHVYDGGGPGIVARCAPCGSVIARLVRTPTDAWLDLRGARSVRIPMP
ncbi:MAG: hypothetical protein GEV28_19180 [Actinophytocola sp.]|uniref:DUF6510 family protein n=1 Tax=Actinophytocola sp. TaxID=1872138 RepID=UPI001322E97D|nr:DUF6510 family protein [Actinophytocola sp.]MPZ82402.1 hypothetical protein [Actinophytocola sp.]